MTVYLDLWTQNRTVGRLTILQQLQIKTMEQPPALVGGLDQNSLALMVDISHWNGDVNVRQMVSEGQIAALFAKASDGKPVITGNLLDLNTYKDDWFDRNCQKAYDAGIPFIPYHYVQPYIVDYSIASTIDWNFRCLKNAIGPKIPGKSFHAICLDFEERTTTNTNGASVMMGLIAAIQTDPVLSKVPIIIYTSVSILNSYPALRDQLSYQGANYNLWLAQWSYTTPTKTDWATLRSTYIPRIEMRVITPGYATWWAVQWSAAFVLPGCLGACDLSFYKGTPTQLYAALNYQQATTPPPPPPAEPPVEQPEYITRAEFEAFKAQFASHTHIPGKPA